MLEKCIKYLIVFAIITVAFTPGYAAAAEYFAAHDPCSGAGLDCGPAARSPVKIRNEPSPVAPLKVRPSSATAGKVDQWSQFNPVTWWTDCCLPMPAKGQFVVGPKIQFARVHGEARRGPDITAIQSSIVDFDDHLNFKKTGNSLWSIQAMYQLRPKWGIRYSFMPLSIEATGSPRTAFNFQGQTFASGTQVFSKWERFQHRGGIYFNLNRTLNSQTNVFADWMSVSDRLTISPASGGASMGVTWDETKNMAVMGLEFDKCLANYQGNTLALSGKGGVAFFSDSIGYEAEATLSYLIPIRPGRFGFIKGGYSYASLKKEKGHELFGVTIDGPFVQLGFLF